MSKRIIKLEHKVCDYTCMWNGIEDLYQRKSGEEVPDHFFFFLSGIGNFVYLKFRGRNPKRMACWNDGRTKKMYQSICDTVGFKYKHIEGRKFEYAMKKAKEEIDKDKPVVLGCLDMYYLEYNPKFYYKEHIPIHYVLMVGYDDEEKCVYIYDCGMKDVQKLSDEALRKALNVEKTSLSDKNAICCIEFNDDLKSIREIAINGFRNKAIQMLNSRVDFCGIRGMGKLRKEIDHWKEELTKEEYEESLRYIVMYTGRVPALPNRLLMKEEVDLIKHQAAREEYATLMLQLGEKYRFEEWIKARDLFIKSGMVIQKMTDFIVEYLIKERTALEELPYMIEQIANFEEEAYKWILKGVSHEA